VGERKGRTKAFQSLHELSKSASVGEGKGRTKAFLNFLCICWTQKLLQDRKERVQLLGQLPVVVVGSKEGFVTIYLYAAMSNTCLDRQMHINEFPSFSVSDLLIQ
jgi:hypothetical protein